MFQIESCATVQSTRSKLTTYWSYPGKGYLLRFELNSTATSDGSAQNLVNYIQDDSESIANKNFNPNQSQMKCYV